MKSQEEIKKGCGKTICDDEDEGTCNYCGEDIKCETCQALLEQAKEFEKEIDKLKYALIECREDSYKNLELGKQQQAKEFQKMIKNKMPHFCPYCGEAYGTCDCKKDDILEYLSYKLQELLKEVQDNSQKEETFEEHIKHCGCCDDEVQEGDKR